MKLKNLFAAALLLCSGTAMAQTDVTSTYLDNADFSSGTPVTVGVCTYAKDKSSNGTSYANLVAVDNWTAVSSADGKAGGLFAIGGGAWLGGAGYTAPATDSDGNTGVNVLGVVTCWSASVQYTQTLKSALPAGTYTLVLAAYNSGAGADAISKNLIGFKESGGTEHYATTTTYTSNTWKYEFITFTLDAETSGDISIGYKSPNKSSSKLPHLFVSGLTLFEGEVDAEAYEAAKTAEREQKEAKVLWDNAVAAANNALESTDYANVTGEEKTALETEVAKTEPTTTDDYKTATTALTTATTAFTSAKSAYDAFVSAKDAETPDLAYASSDKKTAVTIAKAAEAATSADDATTKTAAINTALRAYYESHALAESVEGAVDYTSSITNASDPTNNDGWTWTGSKNNPASNEPWTDADGTNTHSYFDGGNWSANSWTTTMEQTITVPAGRYLLTSKGRAAVNTTMTMAVGEVSVELPHVGSTGNVFDRGWGDASLVFETTTGEATILVTATSSTVHEWFSISDFRLVQLEKTEVPMADADDYADLATAISDAEAYTLGFDKDEYAPYINVDALTALAAAKAINPDAEGGNTKEVVTNATTALTNATWTANTEEVNAIYDGTLANATIQATSENVVLPGWVTKSGNTRQTFKGTGEDGKACLADAEDGVGLFVHPGTYNYGETTGYTMPLDADVKYVAEAKYCSWAANSNNNFTLTILKGSETIATKSYGANAVACTEEGALKHVKLYFDVEEAGDYVLSVVANGNTFMTDVIIKKAVAENVTISEEDSYTPEETYANVTLTRTIKADTWNSFVVPFAISNDDLKAAFGNDVAVAEYSDEGESADAVTANFNKMETPAITANVPVLLKPSSVDAANVYSFEGRTIVEGTPKDEGTYFDFVGTYAPITALTAGDYFIGNGALYKSEGATALKGFRAYIHDKNPAAGVKALTLYIDDIATGIATIENGELRIEEGAIYNVAGQRLNKVQKGINIVNGKKVVVK